MSTTHTTPAENEIQVVTLGKAKTRHASYAQRNAKGYIDPIGYPLCGQMQGRAGQGSRPVNHVTLDLSKIDCAKCAAHIATNA